MKKVIIITILVLSMMFVQVEARDDLPLISNVKITPMDEIDELIQTLKASLMASAPTSAHPGDDIDVLLALNVPYPCDNTCNQQPYVYIMYTKDGACVGGEFMGRYTGGLGCYQTQQISFDMTIPTTWDGKYKVTGMITCGQLADRCVVYDIFSTEDSFYIYISDPTPECTMPKCDGIKYYTCSNGQYVYQGIIIGKCGVECKSDNDCSGNNDECVSYKCQYIQPECTSNADCSTNEECISGTCVYQGPDPTHRTCISQSCTTVQGQGTNDCTTDADCAEPEYHYLCQDETCMRYDGIGDTLCLSDEDCKSDPLPDSHWYILNDKCVYSAEYTSSDRLFSTEEKCKAALEGGDIPIGDDSTLIIIVIVAVVAVALLLRRRY